MSRIKVVTFDLDDTLYPEISYVHSGFLAVSKFLENEYGFPCEKCFESMKKYEKEFGRGAVFDKVLEDFNCKTQTLIKLCISVYRKHTPLIELYPKAKQTLSWLQNNLLPTYIVTDGNPFVQEKKLAALHLHSLVKKAMPTHRYGKANAKPSTFCFELICKRENVTPQKVLYVGDNPHKDFIKIKTLGFQTLRIKQGMFKNLLLADKYEAAHCINSLEELLTIIQKLTCKDVA